MQLAEGSGPILMLDDHPVDLEIARVCHMESGIPLPFQGFQDPYALLDATRDALTNGAPVPALVLLDVRMPRMDGFEVARRIRALAGGEQVPLAMLTTSTLPRDRIEAQRVGARAYLHKPTSIDAYIDLFRDLVREP